MRSPTTSTKPEAVTDLATIGPGPGVAPAAEAETRIARLFEMTSDLLATISLDGHFTLLNPAWERMLGWTLQELQAQPMQEFISTAIPHWYPLL